MIEFFKQGENQILDHYFCCSVSHTDCGLLFLWKYTDRSFFFFFFVSTAMSSYLYIVKYELPIVIQSFMGASNG